MEVLNSRCLDATPCQDDSIFNGRQFYENMLGSDTTHYMPSTFIMPSLNTHNNLGGNFHSSSASQIDPFGPMDPALNTWTSQSTSYFPPFDACSLSGIPINQERWEPAFTNSMAVSQNASEQKIEAMQNPDDQTPLGDSVTRSRSTSRFSPASEEVKSPSKRKQYTELDTTAGATEEPKTGRKRRRRKTKEKSPEEKKARDEIRLQRNRLAASKCREKKRKETEEIAEKFNVLKQENKLLAIRLQESKYERNRIITLLLRHQHCEHAPPDDYMADLLQRVAAEATEIQPSESAISRTSRRSSEASTTISRE